LVGQLLPFEERPLFKGSAVFYKDHPENDPGTE
jgi:hypothetical protein